MKISIVVKFIICHLLIGLLACGILFTQMNMPFSIFFLVPIIYFALQKETALFHISGMSVFASIVWFLTSAATESPLDFVLIANGLIRFGIYFSLSYLTMRLKKQSIELKAKNNELLKLSQEKNIMLGTAAHDIRNAASAIYSFSKILNENLELKRNLEKETGIAAIINRASENLLNLVTSILDLSKIESGQIHLKKTNIDYNTFIKDRIDLLKIIAQNKNIRILFEESREEISLIIDPTYITEVIDNLLSNAIKYSKPGSEIKVCVSVLNKYVCTEVIDSGIGIRESELELLFKPFSTTSARPTAGEPSSGIGLAIAHKVVKLHGGEIGVESVVDKGSTFYFLLPM